MYNVLYVDDEPALLEIAKLILEQQGEFTLTTITSAIEALEIMQKTGYDAVISDYQMPVMDGIEFLKETRAIFGDLPFILFTGKGREEVVIEAINNGADSYIQKGGDPRSQFAELAHKIKNAVERRRAEDALKQDESRFETLVTFYQMASAPLRELMTFAIEKAVVITTSSVGYLAFVNDDETVMTMHAWSAETMNECDIPTKPLVYRVESTGLWGEAIRQRCPVITNHYAAPSSLKKGYPPGHVPITRHMNIPIFDGTHIVMVAGVGNKRIDYDDRDVRELSLLMHGLWNVIKERRAERALRESEEQYRMLAENSTDLIYHMSLPDGRYNYVSPASLTLVGYSPEDFYQNPLLQQSIVHPAWQDYFKQMWTRLLAGDVPPSYEYQIVHKSGEVRWMNHRNMPIRDEEGRVIAVEGVVTDFTDNKENEQALRSSESRYRRLYESMLDAYVVVDMTGRLTEYNSAYREMLGYSEEELSALTYRDVTPEKWQAYEQKIVDEQVLPRGYSDTYQKEYRKKDGTVFPVEMRTFLIRDETGSPAGMWALIRDITERKQAEEALRESEERYRNLADSLPDYLIVHRNGIILYANRTAAETAGLSTQEMVGRHLMDFIAPESRTQVQDIIQKRMLGETPPAYEAVLQTAAGKKKTVIINATGISFVGEPAFLAVITDISDRKRAEEGLRQANQQLTLLSGITRHDILNMVTIILGYLGIVGMKATDPTQKEYFRRMESATRAIQSQIEFTRIYQDLGTHEPQWQSLKAVLIRLKPPPEITLIADLQGVQVYADLMFERVFFNLLDNSIRHGKRVTEVRVSVYEGEEGLIIVWEDNGVGVPAEVKERIFNRGFGENTGFGLFLVHEILSIGGITISETGTQGSGARFIIAVPKGAYRFEPDPS